jgi:hypothetical protein
MTAGPVLFARYALAPNRLGYCGPSDSAALLTNSAGDGEAVAVLRELARQFEGAWPYLELIARVTGIRDPLDARVVEAYWVGNPLLEDVGTPFKAGGRPHHSYQVFSVYPWAGLLADERSTGQALHVLDQCRIRWGRVIADTGDAVVVESRPLTWDGRVLALGAPREETVIRSADGIDLLGRLHPGDWVSLHWQWICDRLDLPRLTSLRDYSAYHLTITNNRLALV